MLKLKGVSHSEVNECLSYALHYEFSSEIKDRQKKYPKCLSVNEFWKSKKMCKESTDFFFS